MLVCHCKGSAEERSRHGPGARAAASVKEVEPWWHAPAGTATLPAVYVERTLELTCVEAA
jgi:hypothetical protein